MVKASITNNSNGMEEVLLDVDDSLSTALVPPRSKHSLIFKNEESFKLAVEKYSDSKTVKITKEGK